MQKREFQVGDLIRRKSDSKDEGRIVRIVDISHTHPPNSKGKRPTGIAYIVSLLANRYMPAKEALWREDEIACAD